MVRRFADGGSTAPTLPSGIDSAGPMGLASLQNLANSPVATALSSPATQALLQSPNQGIMSLPTYGNSLRAGTPQYMTGLGSMMPTGGEFNFFPNGPGHGTNIPAAVQTAPQTTWGNGQLPSVPAPGTVAGTVSGSGTPAPAPAPSPSPSPASSGSLSLTNPVDFNGQQVQVPILPTGLPYFAPVGSTLVPASEIGLTGSVPANDPNYMFYASPDGVIYDFLGRRRAGADPGASAKTGGYVTNGEVTHVRLKEGGLPSVPGAERFKMHHLRNRPHTDYTSGGPVRDPFAAGRRDTVPALLDDGEFVMTKNAVQKLGGGNPALGAHRMYTMMRKLEGYSPTMSPIISKYRG